MNRTPDEEDITNLKISGVVDNFFRAASLRLRSGCPGERSTKSNCRSVFFVKNSRFQKKNRLNRSPDEGDIVDLKISGVADNFSGPRV